MTYTCIRLLGRQCVRRCSHSCTENKIISSVHADISETILLTRQWFKDLKPKVFQPWIIYQKDQLQLCMIFALDSFSTYIDLQGSNSDSKGEWVSQHYEISKGFSKRLLTCTINLLDQEHFSVTMKVSLRYEMTKCFSKRLITLSINILDHEIFFSVTMKSCPFSELLYIERLLRLDFTPEMKCISYIYKNAWKMIDILSS